MVEDQDSQLDLKGESRFERQLNALRQRFGKVIGRTDVEELVPRPL